MTRWTGRQRTGLASEENRAETELCGQRGATRRSRRETFWGRRANGTKSPSQAWAGIQGRAREPACLEGQVGRKATGNDFGSEPENERKPLGASEKDTGQVWFLCFTGHLRPHRELTKSRERTPNATSGTDREELEMCEGAQWRGAPRRQSQGRTGGRSGGPEKLGCF